MGYGAFEAEVFRAGIQSIGKGQMEAAKSLGMTYFQAMRFIVLPQAIRRVLPPLGNDFIACLKDSSLVSVVAVNELTQMGRLRTAATFRAMETYNMVAFLYLSMTLLLSLLVRWLEHRMKIEE
jgi:polar amino acid transport system permease protein